MNVDCPGSGSDITVSTFIPYAEPGGTIGAWSISAPAGLAITGVYAPFVSVVNVNNNQGWGGGDYWDGGGDEFTPSTSNIVVPEGTIDSSYFAVWLVCGWSSCQNLASITVGGGLQFTVTENGGPSLLGLGSNNLWYQGGHYVWNPPGDPWPITLQANDPSGVCGMWAIVNNHQIEGPSAQPDTSNWQECPEATWTSSEGADVDTRDYVAGAGSLSLALAASNAANVASQVDETLAVDNDPVNVAVWPANDPNPTIWVNHAVTVDAYATAGPSGVGGTNCSVDGGASTAYPDTGVTVNGTGVHTVTCTAWNSAIDPQGQPATGTNSATVHIDETPPTLAFEPVDPASPASLVVNTSDAQSGVAGGSIQMAPSGTDDWTSLPTTFDGQHLLAQIPDAGRSGPYVFRATSCDNVGNCATADEALALPLRIADASDVSFRSVSVPAKIVRTRVLVGWHWGRVDRHGRMRRMRVGGHFRTVRLVIARNATCASRRVETGRRRWREVRVCRVPHVALLDHERVRYGRPVVVHGLLVTGQGVPIGGAPVQILSAPDNGLNQFAPAADVTTDAAGEWSATLPPGPSRIIEAAYGGSSSLLPATGQVTVSVPARIGLSITPRAAPWSGAIVLRGHLKGGYIPPDGVALRLLVRYPRSPEASDLLAFRTNSRGTFKIVWSYGGGHGVARYPFWVATTATESDYPFAPAASRRLSVEFGVSTPATTRTKPPRRSHRHR